LRENMFLELTHYPRLEND